MLKPHFRALIEATRVQPPSGGCVLKLHSYYPNFQGLLQPPSGGCVLKRIMEILLNQHVRPAAFGRLCVETYEGLSVATEGIQPPSGGCVLKREKLAEIYNATGQPPSGGCVLKQKK